MAPPSIALRCPRCGRLFAAPAPPGPPAWFPCPHCGQPVTVVGPRDPPPLFNWEVHPHLYPALPAPRVPRGPPGRGVAPLLLAAAITLAALGAYVGFAGATALSPHRYLVQGTVWADGPNGSTRLAGATVNLTGENGFLRTTTTDSRGAFSFSGVPAGGFAVNASAPGYAPETLHRFWTSVFASPDPGSSAVVLHISKGNVSDGSVIYETAFPDLESFVASLWSTTVVFGLGAVVTGLGTFTAFRGRRPTITVVGGGAAALSPVALIPLGVGPVFPLLPIAAGVVAGLGAVAVALTAIPMAREGPPLEPDD